MLNFGRPAVAVLMLCFIGSAVCEGESGMASAQQLSPSAAHNKQDGADSRGGGDGVKSPAVSLMEQLNSNNGVEFTEFLRKLQESLAAEPSCLSELPAAFASNSNKIRVLARSVVGAIVVGTFPTRLENRLGDYSEEDLKSKSDSIMRDHEILADDWKQFSEITEDRKADRIKLLKVLSSYSRLLSEEDNADIALQLNELQLPPQTVSYQYANALLMLGFNYQYFRGLQASAQVLDCLKRAMKVDERLAKDTVFVETAKKALAQTDSEFCALYKKATAKDFDPSQ
ncbi:MAG: hypothetical protein K2W95_13495 [Candidatus Obscuribacterales bacterium]|nr:hypothetical protein [Candidatus Obscuribacterales bacterium]